MITVDVAKRTAELIRSSNPDMAAKIDEMVKDALAGNLDQVNINVGIKYRLEKFEGDKAPGQKPVEVIEGEG